MRLEDLVVEANELKEANGQSKEERRGKMRSQGVNLYWRGFEPVLTPFERSKLQELPIVKEEFLEGTSLSIPQSEDGRLSVAVIKDFNDRLQPGKRFSPVNFEGTEPFNGKSLVVLVKDYVFEDEVKRNAFIRELVSWMKRALEPVDGKYKLPSGRLVETPWGLAPKKQSPRLSQKAKGPVAVYSAKRQEAIIQRSEGSESAHPLLGVSLPLAQKQKEALVVAALGAFNFGVGMDLEDSKLHRIYLQTLKRLALLSEQAGTGAGELMFNVVNEVEPVQIFTDMVIDRLGLGDRGISPQTPAFLEVSEEQFLSELRSVMEYVAPGEKQWHQELLARFEAGKVISMAFYPLIEALITFGRSFSELAESEQEIARSYRGIDEAKHFARIMDPDLMLFGDKNVVGTLDAGNPRIVRLLGYGADHRKRFGLYEPWPIPGRAVVESANFSNPFCPTHRRRNAPYIGGVVSASTRKLGKDLIDIFRRLVTQYPLEQVCAMIEDWLITQDCSDENISITAFQVRNDGGNFKVKAVGIGGGAVVVTAATGERQVLSFPKKDGSPVGCLFLQHPIWQMVVRVEDGDIIQAVSTLGVQDFQVGTPKERPLGHVGVARTKVNPNRHREILPFNWTETYVKDQLGWLVEKVIDLQPETVRMQFGHIHSDRNLGPEQETAALMASVVARILRLKGVSVEVEPVLDNLHVVDRVDVGRYLEELSRYFGEPIEQVSFEASLLDRRLGDELIVKLFQLCPEKVKFIGHNVYLQATPDVMIELYDGIGASQEKAGRQGCVPFMGGYEVRRQNPGLANQLWREIIMNDYPTSLVAQWWQERPDIDNFEVLTCHYVYTQNPERRAALKARLDEEIDRSFQEKILHGNTAFLDAVLAGTNIQKQVLLHFLESTYDAQHTKFSYFARCAGMLMLPLNIYRVSFDRHTGRVVVLDVNNP